MPGTSAPTGWPLIFLHYYWNWNIPVLMPFTRDLRPMGSIIWIKDLVGVEDIHVIEGAVAGHAGAACADITFPIDGECHGSLPERTRIGRTLAPIPGGKVIC